jgi:hypothetical protein
MQGDFGSFELDAIIRCWRGWTPNTGERERQQRRGLQRGNPPYHHRQEEPIQCGRSGADWYLLCRVTSSTYSVRCNSPGKEGGGYAGQRPQRWECVLLLLLVPVSGELHDVEKLEWHRNGREGDHYWGPAALLRSKSGSMQRHCPAHKVACGRDTTTPAASGRSRVVSRGGRQTRCQRKGMFLQGPVSLSLAVSLVRLPFLQKKAGWPRFVCLSLMNMSLLDTCRPRSK